MKHKQQPLLQNEYASPTTTVPNAKHRNASECVLKKKRLPLLDFLLSPESACDFANQQVSRPGSAHHTSLRVQPGPPDVCFEA